MEIADGILGLVPFVLPYLLVSALLAWGASHWLPRTAEFPRILGTGIAGPMIVSIGVLIFETLVFRPEPVFWALVVIVTLAMVVFVGLPISWFVTTRLARSKAE